MFMLIAIIAATIMATDPDGDTKDLYVRLGEPKMETCEYRIHVGNDGQWTSHLTRIYSIEGVTSEDAKDFEQMLIEQATGSGAHSFMGSNVGKNRRQCVSKGKGDDTLKLASLLVNVFEDDKCDFFRWDSESFEWKFIRHDGHSPPREEKKTFGEFASGLALDIVFSTVLDAAFDEELLQKGVKPSELESLLAEMPKYQLVLTTDGKITADSPAEVNEDGKTMTLDLSKFLSDPPEKWSIRIDGL